MKKILLLLGLLTACSWVTYAQVPDTGDVNDPPSYTPVIPNYIPDYPMNPVQLSPTASRYLSGKLSNYRAYDFDYHALNDYLINNPYALEFTLNENGIQTLLTLQRHDLRDPNYIESETDAQGNTSETFRRTFDSDMDPDHMVRMLKGFANKNKDMQARYVIRDNDFSGYVWDIRSGHMLYYTSLQEFARSNGDQLSITDNPLLIFDLADITRVSQTSTCGTLTDLGGNVAEKGNFFNCTPRFVEIAAEGDKSWCDQNGSSAAFNIQMNLFFVECLYTHYFNISFIVKSVNLLTNNSTLYNTNNSDQLLGQFQSNWVANHSTVDRDFAILYTGRTMDAGVLGIAYPYSLCNNYSAYAVVGKFVNRVSVAAHEIGHIFGSLHDQDYGSASCSGSDQPIMCAANSNFSPLFFSPYTRNVILTFINQHASCLNDYANVNNSAEIVKSWSNYRNLHWTATWYMQAGDYMIPGNFDGENDDEEIFFANPDRNWVGIMDFSCDEGTDWYHLWGNSGNRSFGCWYRNYGDRYLAGDFDGDGKDEILSRTYSGNWMQIKDYQPATWSWRERWTNGGNNWFQGWYMNPNDVFLIGDYDGDGKDEILCVNPNGWAALYKLNSGTNGWYSVQTLWSNNGNGSISGLTISQIFYYQKGKMRNTQRDELYAFVHNSSSTFSAIMRFNGSGWTLQGGQGLGSSFTTTNITPYSSNYKMMTGNLDNDGLDEYLAISDNWIGSYDYSNGGPGMSFNWSNGGSSYYNDWYLNQPSRYFLVKAAPTANKQIFNVKYEKRSSGWWFWYHEWYEATLAAMYRGELPSQNMKQGRGNEQSPAELEAAKGVDVFPNPTTGLLNINVGSAIENPKLVVTDVIGRIMLQQSLQSGLNKASLDQLAAGTYMVQVSSTSSPTVTSKVVLNTGK